MPNRNSTSPEDDYFNDLSRQPSIRSNRSDSQERSTLLNELTEAQAGVPRPKRIACIICRKRKLKCDGSKPSCGTCSRLGHKCAYDEVRRKSGPKRGYVKELEARLAQVEIQLKSKDRTRAGMANRTASATAAGPGSIAQPGFQLNDIDMGMGPDMMSGFFEATAEHSLPSKQMMPDMLQADDVSAGFGESLSWEMIGLGLEEPLPPQDLVDDLQQIYFEKVHPSVPMIHKYRYIAAMNLAPHMRPAVCLRYIMWSLAASVTEKYFHYQEVFYHRARKYVEIDEMKGHGEAFITLGHCQCWNLIAIYEFKMMYFPRAWVSSGKSTRLAQMMGLHRCDGETLEVKQTLKPPQDWTDLEERRRTFWAAYCADRYASIGTGWPMTIEEKDVTSKLPSSEEAFEKSKSQASLNLAEAMTAEGAASLSPYAAVAVLATLFGRTLTHLHRPDPNDRPEDPNHGEFWKRHHAMDNILNNIAMYLPDHLRLRAGVRDPNIIFVNLNIHTSAICLHQAAILKAEKYQLGMKVMKESTDRCFLAAGEIVGIVKTTSHMDIGNMNPFMSFCLYVAARIYVHTYKKRPEDLATRSSLEFLLNAMQAQRKKNPLSESFLVQLMVDLEGCRLENPLNNIRFSFGLKKAVSEIYEEGLQCPSVLQPHTDSQPSYHELQKGAPMTTQPQDQQSHGTSLDIPTSHYPIDFNAPTLPRTSSQQSFQRFNAPVSQAQDVLPSQGWGETQPRGSDGIFDTEMSSEHTSDRRASVSNHPTPTTSHQGSSNTSYSPQQIDDSDPTHASRNPNPGPTTSFFNPSAPFSGFTPPADAGFTHGGRGIMPEPDQFGMQPSWDLGHDHVLPGPATGLSPLGWQQMLEGMTWDRNPLGSEPSWRPPPASTHGP
ncbi:hypothetical protein MMC30_005596 [Trapelia coarctata]|nr:hypothetical protein [Trapelia coarctata]